MTAALAGLDDALPGLDWVDIADRPAGAIKLTPLEAGPEPRNLRRIKNEVARRWAAVPLIDVLKETVLRTGCLQAVTSVVGTGTLPPHILAERLMLAIYAYGTNTGIRSVISAAHGHSEEDVRYARRRYLTPDVARTVAIAIADATVAVRDRGLWGEGSTAVASDSTHFRCWDQNLFTEWHSRYGTRRAGLLARRAWIGRRALPDPAGLRVGGPCHGGKRDPARHRDDRGGQLHRHPRPCCYMDTSCPACPTGTRM